MAAFEETPGAYGAKVDEESHVKKDVESRPERVFRCTQLVPVVPRENISEEERCEDIVGSSHATGPDEKDGEHNWKSVKALVVDVLQFPEKPQGFGAAEAYHGTPKRSQDHHVPDGVAKELRHGPPGSAFFCCFIRASPKVCSEVQAQEYKGVSHPIVRTAFTSDELCQRRRYMLVRPATFDDGGGQDRIGGSDACSNG